MIITNEILKQVAEELQLKRSIYPRSQAADYGRMIYRINTDCDVHVYSRDPLVYKWFKNGYLHNSYGPARRTSEGEEWYYLHGEPMTEPEWRFWKTFC